MAHYQTPASVLLRRLRQPDPPLRDHLQETWGPDAELCRQNATSAAKAVERFLEAFGDRPASVFRVPCRLSLNPHSEHQGAWVPYGLHARELTVVAAPGEPGRIRITNTDSRYEPLLTLDLAEEIARSPEAWERGWNEYLGAQAVTAAVQARRDPRERQAGRTGCLNYLAAGPLRLAHLQGELPDCGLDLTLHGDIPTGGGLSSSSTLVVGAMLAWLALVDRHVEPAKLAELAGEAEWYVGTRGGAGDHAAMLLGRRDGLVHLRFRPPFQVRETRYSPFPKGYELLLSNSGIRSEKSAEERLLFNRGIFAYRFAFMALRDALGDAADGIGCLGALHTGRLPAPDLIRLLLRLPEQATPRDLAHRYPDAFGPAARACFGTDEPDALPEIPLRGAAAYGLARVDRGRAMPALLEDGSPDAMLEFGRLMSITHDGDRGLLHGRPFADHLLRLSNERLEELVSQAEAGEFAGLRQEPGFYGASIPELDEIVDISHAVPGVLGAGLMGAGGGGYVLVLAEAGTFPALREALLQGYYAPRNLAPEVEPWRPAAPAGTLLA